MNGKLEKLTPSAMFLGGIAALGIRRALYMTAVDATGRITPGHPLTFLLAGLILAAGVLAVLAARASREHREGPGLFGCCGWLALALGIGLTAAGSVPMAGTPGLLWKLLGFACVPCAALAGISRYRGRTPFFLLSMMPALFLTTHLVAHYQMWCSNPQILDILFPLFATIALIVAAYQKGAMAEGLGSRSQLLAAGYLALFFCLGELAVSSYPWLYLGGTLWASWEVTQ